MCFIAQFSKTSFYEDASCHETLSFVFAVINILYVFDMRKLHLSLTHI